MIGNRILLTTPLYWTTKYDEQVGGQLPQPILRIGFPAVEGVYTSEGDNDMSAPVQVERTGRYREIVIRLCPSIPVRPSPTDIDWAKMKLTRGMSCLRDAAKKAGASIAKAVDNVVRHVLDGVLTPSKPKEEYETLAEAVHWMVYRAARLSVQYFTRFIVSLEDALKGEFKSVWGIQAVGTVKPGRGTVIPLEVAFYTHETAELVPLVFFQHFNAAEYEKNADLLADDDVFGSIVGGCQRLLALTSAERVQFSVVNVDYEQLECVKRVGVID